MQHDEVIWQVIRHNHCSFMAKIETGIFCRNPYNVTGICNRSSCPLANSRYATIREHDGVFYLYMKTIERAHMPDKLWERVKLPANYEKALGVIDKHMAYWPKFLVHKIKQRLTKMTQMRIRMRKLALKTREKIMSTPRKEKKREARKLEKAETAARLEEKIETELLERLKKGVYGGIYNYPVDVYNQALDKTVVTETEDDENPEIEYVVADDELETEMEDDMEDFQLPAVLKGHSDDGVDNDDEEVDIGDKRKSRKISNTRKHGKDETNTGSKKKAKVVIEVEHEGDDETQRTLV